MDPRHEHMVSVEKGLGGGWNTGGTALDSVQNEQVQGAEGRRYRTCIL